MIGDLVDAVIGAVKLILFSCLISALVALNGLLHWDLPGLPSFGWHPEAAPNCVLPGTTPGDSSTAALTTQPALSLASVIPDLPSAIADVQGTWLHEMETHPPSGEQIAGLTLSVRDGVSRWARTVRAKANGKDVPADVAAYRTQVTAKHQAEVQQVAAENAAACNPCNPKMNEPKGTDQVAYRREDADVARAAAAAAGFKGRDLEIAVAIAGAESGFRANATHDNSNATTDYGMWQINSVHGGLLLQGHWDDPTDNAKMAYQVWLQAGGSWKPWSTFNSGAYQSYMAAPTAQTVSDPSLTCAAYKDPQANGAGITNGAWGDYQNGRIPASALCHPDFDNRALVRCDAATALNTMNVSFRAHFGRDISITDSYRSYAGQVSCQQRKGSLCARPGTSNHGWGLALDLGGGVQTFAGSAHRWMVQHGKSFGWVNPSWASQHGSKPESWHFEYVGTPSKATSTSRV